MTEIVEDAIVVESTDLVARSRAPLQLFGTDDPHQIIVVASNVASVLKDVIVKQGMAIKISGTEYIKVEGYTTLGALLGVFPRVEWTRPTPEDTPGWEAAVEVVNGQGVVIGRAEAQCLRAERNWKNRDDFALRSMAQTRAMGKALRMPLGWIAVLAGYEATPAEEMPAPAETARDRYMAGDDDVPFDESRPVQDQHGDQKAHGEPGTGGTGDNFASNADVTAFLELAASVSDEAHDKAVNGIAAHRVKNHDLVDATWLKSMTTRLLNKQKETA